MEQSDKEDLKKLKRLYFRPKKQIGELLYQDSHELRSLFFFVKQHELDHYGVNCYSYVSAKANRHFGLRPPTHGNFIAAYIERLQEEIDKLKGNAPNKDI